MTEEKAAQLAPLHDPPKPRSPEDMAEALAAADKASRSSEAIDGAGGTVNWKIQAEDAEGMIGIKGTSTTIIGFNPRGGKCPCDEPLKIDEGDIKGAGGWGGEHPRSTPYSMVSKHQSLVETAALLFSKKGDAFGHAEALVGWFVKLGLVSDIDYSKTGNATIFVDCANCKRTHKIELKYTAPGTWPAIIIDPIETWTKFGVNLKSKATKRALDQFAHRENFGLREKAIDFIERELVRMEAVGGQIGTVREAIDGLDLPGSAKDVGALSRVLLILDERAEDAQRFFVMNWLFKAFSYMGEYYKKSPDEAEKLLKGYWRPPSWYFEGKG